MLYTIGYIGHHATRLDFTDTAVCICSGSYDLLFPVTASEQANIRHVRRACSHRREREDGMDGTQFQAIL